jgi:uncharacterized protein
MILELTTIKQLGEKNLKANYRFRSFLKGRDTKRIDKTVHQLFDFYSLKIDCTACGNCCRILQPQILQSDLKALTLATNKTIVDFKKEYILTDEEGDMRFRSSPCPFLENNKCTMYDLRPNDCKSYPHIQKKDFSSRLLGVIDSYSICPIVFNVFEDLKKTFNFK